MGDIVETVLVDASEVLGYVGWVYPPAALVGKILGYAAEAEPEAMALLDLWKAHRAAGTTPEQPALQQAATVISLIEARRLSSRSGGESP